MADTLSSHKEYLMRKNYPIFLLFLGLLAMGTGLTGCAKKVEEIKKNMIVDAITDGRWLVQSFTDNDTDITSQFAPYEFQFHDDGTVVGYKGTVESPGTWVGDANALTISSNFPAANDTIVRLNETWKVINNTFTMVEAKPSNGMRIANLKLVKKP